MSVKLQTILFILFILVLSWLVYAIYCSSPPLFSEIMPFKLTNANTNTSKLLNIQYDNDNFYPFAIY